ncbi:hypothetical protein [Actinomadura madurae]|uniref:hypothetical protein n=1 Tax=Actinomadura madurae TaxID=1993 RepID=UPI000D8D2022|nr:hypothetical protein [Actinomadura madurae]SPT50846.1 Uncharacterised protein [Actinomadura madurae]
MREENSVESKPSRRRTTIAAAVGVTALGGAIAAGVLVAGGSQPAPVDKVSAVSGQDAPALVGGASAGAEAPTGSEAPTGGETETPTGSEAPTGSETPTGSEAPTGAEAPSAGGSAGGAGVTAKKKEKCNTVDRYINSATIPKYEWHSSVKYCWNGKTVRIVRANSYLKNASWNVKEEAKPNRIVFNKNRSAVTVMISANVVRPNPWFEVIRRPKVQYRMWAVNGAHTYKLVGNEA